MLKFEIHRIIRPEWLYDQYLTERGQLLNQIKILKRQLTRLPKPARWVIFTFLARPLRKITYITMRCLILLTHLAEVNFRRSVKLMITLSRGEFATGSFLQVNSPEKQLRYYVDLEAKVRLLPIQPKISILLPVYKVPLKFFVETLACVESQIYKNWELCIVDDASNDPNLTRLIETFMSRHPGKVLFSKHETNQHISATSNSCLKHATGEFVALFDHDDRIYPNALLEFVRYHNLHSDADIFYSDERAVGENGEQISRPFYKPSWSPELHLQVNYTTHLTFYRTTLLRDIGGFRKGFEGSQDHDVMLRMVENTKHQVIHIPVCLYEWRIHAGSTASAISAKPYAVTSGIKCVEEHLLRRGRKADISYNSRTFHYNIKYVIVGEPKVSIIIPSKNHPEIIKTCLDSIFALSTWKNFEVIVIDNGSTDPQCEQVYKTWREKSGQKFRVLQLNEPFNFARLNNYGVAQCSGDYVLLLNNDTEVVARDWIEALLQYAQHPEIGAVGAQLRYPDGTIQHAGGILLGAGIGGHACRGQEPSDRTYIDFIQTSHECSFVTGACLMIAKAKYLAVGQLDEVNVPNGFGDVDFCLKLRKLGLANIYSHSAVLTHFESKTRGRSIESFERTFMKKTWGRELLSDPYLNPNLEFGEFFEPIESAELPEPTQDFIEQYLEPYVKLISST